MQVRAAEGATVWEGKWSSLIRLEDPLAPHLEVLRDALVTFPEPGRYDLVLLAYGEDLARYSLAGSQAKQG